MSPKNHPTEPLAIEKQYVFSVTPLEYLDLVWVYRNEIAPFLEKYSECTEPELNNKKINAQDVLFDLRSGILNHDLECVLGNPAICKIARKLTDAIFLPFENAKDIKIRKPDHERLLSARSSFADLLQKPYAQLSSSLTDGEIEFCIKENVAKNERSE